MKKVLTLMLFFLNSMIGYVYATDFSSLGVIDGSQSASLIVSSGMYGDDVIFGTGYNTPTYQGFYTVPNLSNYYSTPITAPHNFVDATASGVSFASRPYSVYNLVVRGAGTFVFQVSDHNYTLNQVGPSTVDLMAALYVKPGSTTAFDPSNTLSNLVVVNDDNSAFGGSNPYAVFYQNTNASDCITMSLVYFPWSSAPLGQQVDITASGPGQIASSCSALGPSTDGTQTSLERNASALQGIYNLKASIINNGLNYDCSLFDVHGLCISTGGRITNTNTPTGDSTGALVVGGYRVNENVRVGAYLDQGVSSSTPTGFNLKQHNPLFGAYVVWQARQDGLGSQVKVAAGYNDSDMTVTRAVVGTSEAGSGSTSLISQAVSVTGSYGVEMQGSWIASPYVGIRYTDVKAGGYTEASSASVTAPLSYASLSQSTTSLLAGIRWSGKLADRVGLNGSVGVEQDVSNNNSSYTATGLAGLTSIVFNTDINKTRPVASIGTTVSIDKRQQLAFSVFYSEQAFSKSSSTSAYGTYTIGF
jgi:hypothetical protein